MTTQATLPPEEVAERLDALRRRGAVLLRAQGQPVGDILTWDSLGKLLGMAGRAHGNLLARCRGSFRTTRGWMLAQEARLADLEAAAQA